MLMIAKKIFQYLTAWHNNLHDYEVLIHDSVLSALYS